LLTLAGHVPADVQLRALNLEEECALKVLAQRTWRGDDVTLHSTDSGHRVNVASPFQGQFGLGTAGRIMVRVPSRGPLKTEDLVGSAIRVAWSATDLQRYHAELDAATRPRDAAVVDSRAWLAGLGEDGLRLVLDDLKEGALRTAPFILYAGDRQYTNFRDQNTLTGKTLWPGHPDCVLSSLISVPLGLWADEDVLLVSCLALLVRSAGYGRIEEANGTQLSPDHVAHLLERTRVAYNGAGVDGTRIPPARSSRMRDLDALARAIAERRPAVMEQAQLYREIHGALVHKVERVAGSRGAAAWRRESELCERLADHLPFAGTTLKDIAAGLEEAPDWLSRPHGAFHTGLESLVHQTVAAATSSFEADFGMSRGLRNLPALVAALRDEEYSTITGWEIPHFFCCVVATPEARRFFGDSDAHVADVAWAFSSRMQFNSWHFLVGNLPKVTEVEARDYFVPPAIPDIAYYSDMHHNGHVASKVRFAVRSPQGVDILGRRFHGFLDLRLLRCEGPPFDEQDLLAADRTSALIAKATSLAASLVAAGTDLKVTSFDAGWHRATILGDG
jgi:hypothetical protein